VECQRPLPETRGLVGAARNRIITAITGDRARLVTIRAGRWQRRWAIDGRIRRARALAGGTPFRDWRATANAACSALNTAIDRVAAELPVTVIAASKGRDTRIVRLIDALRAVQRWNTGAATLRDPHGTGRGRWRIRRDVAALISESATAAGRADRRRIRADLAAPADRRRIRADVEPRRPGGRMLRWRLAHRGATTRYSGSRRCEHERRNQRLRAFFASHEVATEQEARQLPPSAMPLNFR